MKLQSLRSSLVSSALAVIAAFLLGSCGGGGASNEGPVGGPSQILPSTGTLYAGVTYTITVAGGRPPYFLSSSEPELLAVPQRIDGNFFTVTPNNTAVIDTGLPPEALPTRSVTLTARDSIGNLAVTTGLSVAQNFFTGYGVFFTSNCAAPTTGGAPAACSGGETAVTLVAAINGNRFGNRTYRFEILRGPFFWVFPNGQIAGNTMTVTTNHEGQADAIFRVNNNVPTQLGVFRVTDVATGVSTEHVITIDGIDIAANLVAIPNEFTFTGAFTNQCGTGTGDFLVFDGIPPYTAVSSFPNSVSVTPTTSDTQPGRFRINVTNPFVCLSDATVIVTDANNARTTVTINTEPGEEDPPPPPLAVTPSTITLGCGESASASVIGGEDTISASSASPNVSVTVSGRTLTVTRAGVPPETPPDVSTTVTITDGNTSTNLTVRAPTACS